MDANLKKAVDEAAAAVGRFEAAALAIIQDAAKKVAARKTLIDAADKKNAALGKALIDETNKLYAELQRDKAAALKTYMELVKKTDGMTSVRPSVAKALDRFMQTLDEKLLAEATATLTKHRDEVVKGAPKGDKTAAAFAKGIDALIVELS